MILRLPKPTSIIRQQRKSHQPKNHQNDLKSQNSPHIIRDRKFEGCDEDVGEEDEGQDRSEDVQPVGVFAAVAPEVVKSDGGEDECQQGEDGLDDAEREEP